MLQKLLKCLIGMIHAEFYDSKLWQEHDHTRRIIVAVSAA